MIPLTQALRYVAELRAAGVGLKTIARRSGVSHSLLVSMIKGKIKRSRRDTVDAILAVLPTPPDGTNIDGAETWRLIEDLLSRGWTRMWIAQKLGAARPSLQIKRHAVTVETARRVRELHARLEGLYPHPRALRSRWAYTPPPGVMTAEP